MKTMKTILSISSAFAVLAMATLPVQATNYTGTGTANGGGANGEGISSVSINNNASDITFTINSSAAQSAYVQYFVLMQYVGQGASGSTALLNSAGALNSWGPSLGISSGENAFVATWNTGASAVTYSGGVWTQNASVSYDAGGTGSSFVTFTVPLSSLGLSAGSQFLLRRGVVVSECRRAICLWFIGQHRWLSGGDGQRVYSMEWHLGL